MDITGNLFVMVLGYHKLNRYKFTSAVAQAGFTIIYAAFLLQAGKNHFNDNYNDVGSEKITFSTLRIRRKNLLREVWNDGECVEISLQWQHLVPWSSSPSPAIFFMTRAELQ
jgi:hypothetical protein